MKPITKDITEDAFERIKSLINEDSPKKAVSLLLTPIQKNQLYHYISNMLKSGEDHDIIVQSIVIFVSDFLKEKHEEQFETKVPKGGVFRRSE